MPALK